MANEFIKLIAFVICNNVYEDFIRWMEIKIYFTERELAFNQA